MAVKREKRSGGRKAGQKPAEHKPAGRKPVGQKPATERRIAERPIAEKPIAERPVVQRVQTGVRLETRLLKVMKAIAEIHDISLGDLIEGVMLHALEGRAPFSRQTLGHVKALREVYGLTLTAADAHRLEEAPARDGS
ncbi:MAG TPA: hypothetical protein VND94_09830 [Terriglobia bacterium]|nr:hypothetical protein [Terriglobia bacterium]